MNFSKCTKLELTEICKNNQIGYSGKKKDEIIKLLSTSTLVNGIGGSSVVNVKPVIKWVGGKSQILSTVLSLFPKKINNYHEPFLGGGSVLIGLLMKQKEGDVEISGVIRASDLNLALIGMYQNIQSHPHALIEELKRIMSQSDASKHGTVVNRDASSLAEAMTSEESHYYYIRKTYNAIGQDDKTSLIASAMFIFMNKTCFRGVYREGPNGFNVPFGHYVNPSIMDEMHILFISDLIKDVIFTRQTYDESLSYAEEGDFIYFDPPYAPENANSFVAYNACGFNHDNHEHLFNSCLQLSEKNIKFVMSNSDVQIVKSLFPTPDYQTKIVSCRRTINSSDPSARTNEVLISN